MRWYWRLLASLFVALVVSILVVDLETESGFETYVGLSIVLFGFVYHCTTIYSSEVVPVRLDSGTPVPVFKEWVEARKRVGALCLIVGLIDIVIIFSVDSASSVLTSIAAGGLAVLFFGFHFLYTKKCMYCGKVNNFTEEACRNCEYALDHSYISSVR